MRARALDVESERASNLRSAASREDLVTPAAPLLHRYLAWTVPLGLCSVRLDKKIEVERDLASRERVDQVKY